MRTSPIPACLGALLSAALFAPLPAVSQMYKWTDERGVVSYSNTPPPGAGKATKVDLVEERVSVYTPDPLTLRAMAEEEANSRDAKTGKRKREAEGIYLEEHVWQDMVNVAQEGGVQVPVI